MTREVRIIAWCDAPHSPDPIEATVEVTVSLNGSKPVLLDLCAGCNQLMDSLRDLMARGTATEAVIKPPRKGGIGRPPKETPGPHICPFCQHDAPNRKALATHLRTQHNSGLKKAGV